MTLTADKPKCPHARVIRGGDESLTICDLEDHTCLLDAGLGCEQYNQFLKESEYDR